MKFYLRESNGVETERMEHYAVDFEGDLALMDQILNSDYFLIEKGWLEKGKTVVHNVYRQDDYSGQYDNYAFTTDTLPTDREFVEVAPTGFDHRDYFLDTLAWVISEYLRGFYLSETLYLVRNVQNRQPAPSWKDFRMVVDDKGILKNPYQVIEGLPALPEFCRPYAVRSGEFRLQKPGDVMSQRLGNWDIIYPIAPWETKKVAYERPYPLADGWRVRGMEDVPAIPEKYRGKVEKYARILEDALQGVEL